MKRLETWIGVAGVLVAMLLAGAVSAQNITGFKDGYLTFANTDTNLFYRVEFRPNLMGSEEWSAQLPRNVKCADEDVTVPVGVFYRIVGSSSPMPEARVQITGQTTSYQSGDDGDLEKGVAWPSPRFVVATNGEDAVVTDSLTGLMWTKTANIDGQKTWTNAIHYCRALDHAGYTDWRLPNVRELHSLISYGQSDPALPSGHPFTVLEPVLYWSSTTSASNAEFAWLLYLFDGFTDTANRANEFYVWPVRGGQ